MGCEGHGRAGRGAPSNALYADVGIMQSIFRSASRREVLGKHSKGRRRDAGLKMDWTKPLPERGLCVLNAGWILGEDRNGSETVSVRNRRDGSWVVPMGYHNVGGQDLSPGKCSQ
jgi:hypothetical protein